jgi:hypothetical protein
MAVDASYIYWGNQNNGTIGRADLDGSTVNPSFITASYEPLGLAVGPG